MKTEKFKPKFIFTSNHKICIYKIDEAILVNVSGGISILKGWREINKIITTHNIRVLSAAEFSCHMVHNLEQIYQIIETIDAAITHYNL